MTRIGVLGAGRTGSRVVAAIDGDDDLELVGPWSRSRPMPDRIDVDVVVDFSMPEGLSALLERLDGVPLVTGTTGLDALLTDRLEDYAGTAPVLRADNFSTGVTLLLDLAHRAAAALPDAHVEIVELHHRHKVDSPSGTALALGRAVAAARDQSLREAAVWGRQGAVGPRTDGEIGVHAVRGGDVIGEHTVYLLADGERVTLGHVAHTRATFARGAVRAARWIVGKPPGRYTLRDVIGL